MKRIIIIGTSGSGKTTLAKFLSKILKIDCVDLDEHNWLPGWKVQNKEDFTKLIDQLTKEETWIISGNYSNIINLTWSRCDSIIWLDYSILRCLYRAFYRSLKRIFFHEVCCNGNYESFKRLFSKDSILLWIITSFKKRKTDYGEAFKNKIVGKNYYRFTTPKETDTWLTNLMNTEDYNA